MDKSRAPQLFAARLLLTLLFVASGANKLAHLEPTQAYMQAGGVPGALAPLVVLLELGGGLALLLGWQTRLLSLLLAGFTLVAGAMFHHNFADQVQTVMFLKNLSIAGGFLALAAAGAGAWSLDAKAGRAQ